MQPIRKSFFLLITFITLAVQAHAQTCTGSLGDPVINQDFGSGANPGGPLQPAVTNMTYNSTGCPNDGEYTIANSVGNCFGNTWHLLSQDHTGNPNGYMMVVNASYQPSIFFTQTANGLCPNTTYEFAAWIMNLNLPSACGGSPIKPNITFSISTTNGTLLQTYNTGDIPTANTGQWVKYGIFFSTPANVSSVIVTMTNNATGGCGNDIALDDITFRACGPIINLGFASTSGPADMELCEGSNAVYTLKADVLGTNTPVYQWQYNYYGKGWSDIPGKTADTLDVGFINASIGSYQYRLGVANGSNISSVQCRVYSPVLTVNVNPLPVVPSIAAQTVCQGDVLQLTASGGATYTWSGPGISQTSQNPLIINNVTPANAGTYTVQVLSIKGCAAPPVQTVVRVVPKVTPGISNDVTMCAGGTTQLLASGGLHYKWMPSTGLNNDTIPNPVAAPLQTTTYNVTISNGGCADRSKSVKITINQNPVANAGSNKVIFQGQSVKLNGTVTGDNVTSFFWSPANFLDDPTSLTPNASPPYDITYTLYAISSRCGISTSNVFVKVYQQITIPNAFSPNSDGINDYWNIDALVTYPESSILVFNRYGQKVYQSTGYAKPWDGTYNGAQLPQGTYYYVIDLKNDTPKIAGWVFIVR